MGAIWIFAYIKVRFQRTPKISYEGATQKFKWELGATPKFRCDFFKTQILLQNTQKKIGCVISERLCFVLNFSAPIN